MTSHKVKPNGAENPWVARQQLSHGSIPGSVISGETQEGDSWQGRGKGVAGVVQPWQIFLLRGFSRLADMRRKAEEGTVTRGEIFRTGVQIFLQRGRMKEKNWWIKGTGLERERGIMVKARIRFRDLLAIKKGGFEVRDHGTIELAS